MGAGHVAKYEQQGYVIPKRVWFSCPSNDTALIRGQGLCYNGAYAETGTGRTATDSYGKRGQVVVLPSTTTNNRFAGVTSKDYSMVTAGTNQGMWIDIYEPGSVCEVAIGIDTTINTGFLTCSCGGGDVGLFSRPGMPGRGSMIPLQTVSTGHLVRVADGSGSITTATLTDTDALGSVAAGDYCYLIGGGVAATGVADATGAYGKYSCAAPGGTGSNDTVVLSALTAAGGHDNPTSAPSFTAATSVDYVIMSGQQYCLAYLQDGPESGCQEYLSVNDTTAVDAMVGGTSHINGAGQTMGAAGDANLVAHVGVLLKRFVCEGGQATTTDQTITESGVTALQMDGTAFAALTVAAAADHALFMFDPLGTTAKTILTDMTES